MTVRKRKIRWLKKGDTVVTAFFETDAGPGWVNRVLWVIVQDEDKKLRREAIQKEEYEKSAILITLVPYSERTHLDMRAFVSAFIQDMLKG